MYDFLKTALLPVVNEACATLLRDDDKNALASWYDSIDCDGHLEVSARNSITGNPRVLRFTALNQAAIDEATLKLEDARAAENEELADEISDNFPTAVWGA